VKQAIEKEHEVRDVLAADVQKRKREYRCGRDVSKRCKRGYERDIEVRAEQDM
jgi:hypothetical protein